MTIREDFDKARKAWPGIKASLDVEWDNLWKVCKAHKLNGSKVVPQLMPSIERYLTYCSQRKIMGDFIESPCSFTVYINQRRWTREYPKIAIADDAGKTKLFPIAGRVCGIRGCPMPAVYKNSKDGFDYYRCSGHLPEQVRELYD